MKKIIITCTRVALPGSNIGYFFIASFKKKINRLTDFHSYSPFGVVLYVGNFFKIERKSLIVVVARFPVREKVTSPMK